MREPVRKTNVPPRLRKFGNGQLPADQLSEIVSGGRLWSEAAFWWNHMCLAAERDGVKIKSVSAGYRSLESQERLFFDRYRPRRTLRRPAVTRVYQGKKFWLRVGKAPAATPGRSDHGWGLSQDVEVPRKTFNWLCANAPRFGFYMQAPKGSPEYEKWHWSYCHAQ